MELTPTMILNLALMIVPPGALVLAFWQRLAQHIRWTVALTALCDVLLFWDELFYYESFGLFAVLILVQLPEHQHKGNGRNDQQRQIQNQCRGQFHCVASSLLLIRVL